MSASHYDHHDDKDIDVDWYKDDDDDDDHVDGYDVIFAVVPPRG